MRLGLALADLTESIKLKFRQQVAVAAGLAASDGARVAAAYSSTQLRRLLQAAVKADVVIGMSDQASAETAAKMLTQANIDKAVASASLPAVMLLSPAVVNRSPSSG